MKEDNLNSPKVLLISLSFLLGMILEVLPLPHWAVWARPEWLLLILIYWTIQYPQRFGIFVAFCVGIVMDLLTGTLLGQHAFTFMLAVYLIHQFPHQLGRFPLWQQLITLFVVVLLQLALQCVVLAIIGHVPQSWGYWVPAFTSMLVWPWFYLLNRYHNEMIQEYQ